MIAIATILILLAYQSPTGVRLVEAQNNENRGIYLDRFTYNSENILNDVDRNGDGSKDHTAIDYSPENWRKITCNEGSKLDQCLGYTDKWTTGRDWGVSKNYCKSCPAGKNNGCGRHHQSPVNLQRGVGLDDGDIANECIVSAAAFHFFIIVSRRMILCLERMIAFSNVSKNLDWSCVASLLAISHRISIG